MKVLTAPEMRDVDRRTIELGIPGIVLMENAGHRVIEVMADRFAPLASHRIAVLCGKGNNGGDGMVIARQLHTRVHPRALHVILFADPADLKGDAAANYKMLTACGCEVSRTIPAEARMATLVVDALLGTGITGSATGPMLDAIQEINRGFPLSKVVAVDIPSGMPSDSGEPVGERARADITVTFTAPKPGLVLPPNCDAVGELIVGAIGSPPSLYDGVQLELVEPAMFAGLLAPRPPGGHKGTFGHVLVVAGSPGKTGAAAMAGLGALRAGAGLVTVASAREAVPQIAAHAPELMTDFLDSAPLLDLAKSKTVVAIGPGLGHGKPVEDLVATAFNQLEQPVVLDADALAVLPGTNPGPKVRVLTPHPGEMARLAAKSTADVQKDRLATARSFASERGVTLVLKGERTLIAFPDGRVWINPTGTPAMGTGGTGDVLTGMISGMLAQFPDNPSRAVAAAVYLHGLSGQIGAQSTSQQTLIATDLLKFLPQAIAHCARI